jgi:MoaA/NifB/PqqE/SkfB family radical SAM enzyme
MTISRFEQIITAVKPFTDHIYFHLMGEPLLNPNVAKFLEIAHAAGLKVNLTTNGTLLSANQSVLLEAPALRQVNISLSSFEANEMNSSLESYLETVAQFVNAASKQSQPICSIRLWNMDTAELKGSNTFNHQIINYLEHSLEMPTGSLIEMLSHKMSAKVKERVYINMAEKFEWPDMEKAQENTTVFCYGLRDQLGILVDGTVVPCCLDSDGNIPLGNVLEMPLDTIINSKRAVALYEGFSNRVAIEPLCQKCGYAKKY